MKSFISAIIFCISLLQYIDAQSVLFDNTKVDSVRIIIPPDSLQAIYKDPYSEKYYKATFVYGKDTIRDIGFRLRGNSSRRANKKSYKVSFNEFVSGRRYQNVKKLNLNGQHNDPSMIREKLFYDLWNEAGMPSRRTSFVKLYVNNAYFGLYTLLEEFDKDWLTRAFKENDNNLYKCTYPADLAYLGTNQQTYKNLQNTTSTGGRVYELQTNETEDDYSGLVQMISVINRLPLQIDSVEKYVDVPLFLKALAMDVATGNWDDYAYNRNNYFLYQAANSQFKFITYDTDNSAGIDWVGKDWATRNVYSWASSGKPLANNLLGIDQYKRLYSKYLDTIARQLIAPTHIFPKIDQLKNLITEAALRDTFRTKDYGFDASDFFNSFEKNNIIKHAPYGVKPFFETRFYKILEQNTLVKNVELQPETFLLTLVQNPVGSVLEYRTEQEVLTVQIFSSDGKVVYTSNTPTQQSIDVSWLATGSYHLVVWNTKKQKATITFLKF